MRNSDDAPMTHDALAEAGRRGGEKTRALYGKEFYASIGRKGGEANRRKDKAQSLSEAIEDYSSLR